MPRCGRRLGYIGVGFGGRGGGGVGVLHRSVLNSTGRIAPALEAKGTEVGDLHVWFGSLRADLAIQYMNL